MAQLTATVIKRVVQTADVVTLDFTVAGSPLCYTAGQYITVYFDDTLIKQGKAYSISSSPHDPFTSITVKKIGLFSGKLHDLQIGDTFKVSTPYGFFNAKNGKPVIAIAAGVGIAPIWSIIRYEYSKDGNHPQTKLLYSNKSHDDIAFRSDIDTLSGREATFTKQYFVTRDADETCTSRRIDVAQDIDNDNADHSFYVCGSADFVGSMWRQLAAAGVSEHSISTETFFEIA
jgi:NADH oxidoreductase Hcr